MNRLYTLVAACLFTGAVYAQSPELINYQAVVRDASQQVVSNGSVGMQISILQGSPAGTAVYAETHSLSSNANGVVAMQIGGGTLVSGNFSTIDWSAGPYFIQTEVDPAGGTNYTVTGTSQLVSVPYALHAETAANVINDAVDDADNDPTNEIETWSTLAGIPSDIADGDDVNDADNDPTNEIETWSTLAGIPSDIADGDDVNDADNDPNNEIQDISLSGNNLSISGGSTVNLSSIVPSETDPVFSASDAAGITAGDIANWNSGSAAQTYTIPFSIHTLSDDALMGGTSFGTMSPLNYRYINFPDGGTRDMGFAFPVPSNYAGGNIKIKVHYTGNVASGNFVLRYSMKHIGINETLGAIPGGTPKVIPAPAAPNGLTVHSKGFGLPADAEFVYIHLRREGNNGQDTNTGDLRIFNIAIEYTQ